MRIAVGADHAGYKLKTELLPWLEEVGGEIIDLGAHEYEASDDYPDFALAVAAAVSSGKADRGIVFCGSGVGACITANKVPGARACLCHDTFTARQGVEHDDMNIICLGGRVIGVEQSKEVLGEFLNAGFLGEPRFQRRLEKLLRVEKLGVEALQSEKR